MVSPTIVCWHIVFSMLYCACTWSYVVFSGFSHLSRNFLANFREGARKRLNLAENWGGLGIIRDDLGSCSKVLKTVWVKAHGGSNPSSSANKKRTFVYRQRCVFWMMFAKVRFANFTARWCWASPMMTATPNDVCLTAHWGKHRIIAERSGATSFLRSKCIISPQGDASFEDIQSLRLDFS